MRKNYKSAYCTFFFLFVCAVFLFRTEDSFELFTASVGTEYTQEQEKEFSYRKVNKGNNFIFVLKKRSIGKIYFYFCIFL